MDWHRAKYSLCQRSCYLLHCLLEALPKHFWNGLLYKNKIQQAAIVWDRYSKSKTAFIKTRQKDTAAIMMPDDESLTMCIEYESHVFCRKNEGDFMCKTQQQFHPFWRQFLKPLLRQHEVMLHGGPHLCFWQFFCPAGCCKYSAHSLLQIILVRHKKTPSHLCKNTRGGASQDCRTTKQKRRRTCHWEEL